MGTKEGKEALETALVKKDVTVLYFRRLGVGAQGICVGDGGIGAGARRQG